nr:alpha/beta hydrolase [Nocardiopsis sp. MG754419]
MRDTGAMACVAVATLLLAGCAPSASDGTGAEPGDVDWSACLDESELEEVPTWGGDPDWSATLECGTLAVPLDHAAPDGETVDLALVRRPAEGPAHERIGSLVVNPGGPGESGVAMLDFPLFDDAVRGAFDLVSFDPRGVGDSGGFACGDWFAMDDARRAVEDPTKVTDPELDALEETARAYADACVEEVGADFLARIGTVDVVRDLDLIRQALGDAGLTYVGFSYGTHVGALYADLFPDTTRALVLDGAVETERANVEIALDQASGFRETWELFVADCLNWGECPFSEVGESEDEMVALADRLDADPPRTHGMAVDGPTLLAMVSLELYHEDAWPGLARTLAALDRDPRGADAHLDALYDATFGLQEDDGPRADEEDEDGSGPDDPTAVERDEEAALTAINCADRDDPTDPEVYRRAAQEVAADSPLFGPDLVWEQLPCAYWVESEETPTGFTAPDAPPIVVIGTVGDPATPYTWAEELTDQLDSAVLVTYEGAGHTVYGYGEPCVDAAIDAYLLDEEVPDPGLSCPRA